MNTAAPLRAALYLRVSTDDQTVDNQIQPLRDEAERRGWILSATIYKDEGISGAKGRDKRPGLDTLLRDAARGRFDVAMCWSLDRLGRSLSDLIAVSMDLEKSHCALFLLKDNIDTTTAAGRFYFHVMGAMAEFERGRLTERVKAGMARAKKAGKHIGRPGIDEDTKNRIVQLLKEGVGQLRIAKRLKTGTGTVQRIAAELKQGVV